MVPLHQIAHVGISPRTGLNPFGREIIFEEFPPKRYKQTDGRTARQFRIHCGITVLLEYDGEQYLSHDNLYNPMVRGHGPAIIAQPQDKRLLSTDLVRSVYDVYCGRHKPLIGQHDTETTAGQTQQLLTALSATAAMWFVWHIVSVDNMNGWASFSGDCHSHEQKLYC